VIFGVPETNRQTEWTDATPIRTATLSAGEGSVHQGSCVKAHRQLQLGYFTSAVTVVKFEWLAAQEQPRNWRNFARAIAPLGKQILGIDAGDIGAIMEMLPGLAVIACVILSRRISCHPPGRANEKSR
jgi:hypothetical protein